MVASRRKTFCAKCSLIGRFISDAFRERSLSNNSRKAGLSYSQLISALSTNFVPSLYTANGQGSFTESRWTISIRLNIINGIAQRKYLRSSVAEGSGSFKQKGTLCIFRFGISGSGLSMASTNISTATPRFARATGKSRIMPSPPIASAFEYSPPNRRILNGFLGVMHLHLLPKYCFGVYVLKNILFNFFVINTGLQYDVYRSFTNKNLW